MMRKFLPLLLVACAGTAAAQNAPFDMSPELRPSQNERTIPLGLAPRAAQRPEAPAPAAREVRSHFLPGGGIQLSGEMDEQSWTVMLGAAWPRNARLHLGYQNSVMVAPEASVLRVSVNGTVVGERPVRSPDGITDLEMAIPDGVLHRGANTVSVATSQRHRTDCTAESTYQLWTELQPGGTYLGYETDGAPRFSSLEDISAIGMDSSGVTRVSVVAPGAGETVVDQTLLLLAQKIALTTQAPHLVFDVSRKPPAPAEPAALTVILGTHDELRGLPWPLPGETALVPVVRFLDTPRESPVLLVGAPTPRALGETLADWGGGTGGPGEDPDLWPRTRAPLLSPGGSIPFAALGVPTEQFTGRRYVREFSIAVPPDFYAQSYGEAKIMLDAAFSEDVRPGSRFDIYVNDQIATTVPIMDTGGGVLRQLPIRVALREMKPGTNSIRFEAIMMTQADEACAPGTTTTGDPRFGMFSTSRLVMPDYARIAQRPDLAAFAAAAAPYAGDGAPLPLVLDLRTEATLSAAMDVTARMAATTGHVSTFEIVRADAGLDARNAIFLSPATHMTPAALDRVGFVQPDGDGWGAGRAAPAVADADAAALEEWRASLENSPVRRRLRGLREMLQENFDLSLAAIRLAPGGDATFSPSPDDTLVIAQASNPAGTGTWTVITAPDAQALKDGAAAIADRTAWSEVAGRFSVYSAAAGQVASVPVVAAELVPTQPWTIGNARLIVTNWMSENALAYSLLLLIACALLGGATLALLKQLGRRS
jgi:cellulose synthase operon protein B